MVKAIDEIPVKAKRASQGEQLRHDIKRAIDEGMTLFEITGDCYNNKYLAQNAREAAKDITASIVTARVREQITWKYWWRFWNHSDTQYIRIYSQKQEDNTFRVFGEIDNDELEKTVNEAVEEAKREHKKTQERERARA